MQRKISPNLMEELKTYFGKDLSKDFCNLLKDPSITTLLPYVRPAHSFTTLAPASLTRINKESALRPVGSLTDAFSEADYFNPILEASRKYVIFAVNNLAKAFSAMRPGTSLNLVTISLAVFKGNREIILWQGIQDGLPVMDLKNRQRTLCLK